MHIKFDSDVLSLINVFSDSTGVIPKDCINLEDNIIFTVPMGEAALSIGKNGETVKLLQKMLGKNITIVEYSDEPVKFLENILRPTKLVSGYVAEDNNKQKKLEATVDDGLTGKKIKLVKFLMERYFNISNINIK
ncbi:MAG: NusA-like transcription termination signal-binding factor [Candidatus Parvarchaeota archaeon]|nr:NusA-like transcription termination signal-binding factor [Candidatus Parvarchaeota archaeon]MCW1301670.1 NusA-like transcription termination signal-binding factor [Candidatus Parvarchaeota archaeon]